MINSLVIRACKNNQGIWQFVHLIGPAFRFRTVCRLFNLSPNRKFFFSAKVGRLFLFTTTPSGECDCDYDDRAFCTHDILPNLNYHFDNVPFSKWVLSLLIHQLCIRML